MKIIRRIFRQITRFLRDGLKSIYNNFFMSLSSVITLSITLSLCSMSVLFAYNTEDFTTQIESEIKIFIEFNEFAQPDEIELAIQEIEALPNVARIDHMTKDESYDAFIEGIREDDPELASFFESTSTDNPLVDTAVITADSVGNVEDVANQLKLIGEVDYVDFGEESTLTVFMTMTDAIRQGLIIVIIVLVVLAVFLIQNTIRLTIYSRRHELAIMKLVGASSAHIVIPFLIEGVIIGLFGALVPILLTVYGYQYLYEAMSGQLFIDMLQLRPPVPFGYELGSLIVVISVVISLIGSFIAVFRYAVKA